MSELGFSELVLDNTDRFYRISFNQFAWWKKVQGTKCQVVRIKENTSYRKVFGSIASSTLPDDEDAEKFPYVILISMNDMKRLFLKSTEPLNFYDNEDKLKLGDILVFSRKAQQFKWKITDIQTFNETDSIVRQYTILGLTETDSLR